MKRFYVLTSLLAVAIGASAQQDVQVAKVPKDHYKAVPKIRQAESMPEVESQAIPTVVSQSHKFNPEAALRMTYYEEVIGLSRYDLQSNASVQNRLAKTGLNMSAGFTFSLQDVDYTDRGTGYNYYGNDESWEEELPYERLEDVRVGWPSVMHTGSGKEVIITHDGTLDLYMVSRDMNSGDDWTQAAIPNPSGRDLIWPRACAGGADGNSIHLIVVTEPIANGGTEYEGLDGALIYYRSTDQGATWDIQGEILPGTDSLSFLGYTGDAYYIGSNGDRIAFAVFNDFADSYVMISEDNGDTWTKRTLVDFPVDLYVVDTGIDLNEDAAAD
ncbi:MAG: repeat-like domain, partial [Bacteroidota bacterium]